METEKQVTTGRYSLDEIKKLNIPREQVKILVSSEIEFGFEDLSLKGKWPNVTALKGDFCIRGKAEFPELRTINGNINVLENSTSYAPKCESIGGFVRVDKNGTFDAPKCESIGGYVAVLPNGTFKAPEIKSIGWGVEVYENGTFKVPKIKSIRGDVTVWKIGTFEAPKLESIGRDVLVCENGTFKAPECERIEGTVRVHETATFDAPKWKPGPRFTLSELQSFGATVVDGTQMPDIRNGKCYYSLDQTSFPRQHPAEYAKVQAYLKDDKLSKVPMKELIERAKAEVKAEKVRGMVMHGPENSQGKGKGVK